MRTYKRGFMEEKIREAIRNDEFDLYYQPQYKYVKENNFINLIGAEALIRWHSKYGVIHPTSFIKIAEKNGQILKIGEIVLTKALNTLKEWNEIEHMNKLDLSVNVSPSQLESDTFIPFIFNEIEKHGLYSSKLKLEITKGNETENFKEVSNTLFKLREKRIKISLNNYGMEYTSLETLLNVPACQMKIDKIFVKNLTMIEHSLEARQTISSMKEFAGKNNKTIVAEGVETYFQLSTLLQIGIIKFQGFFFEKPVDKETFLKLVETTSCEPLEQFI